MIKQTDLGSTEADQKRKIRSLIKNETVTLAGNRNLKIYGRLDCASGRRLKPENRVFFKTMAEALCHGYRPCGHCMPMWYQKWKEDK